MNIFIERISSRMFSKKEETITGNITGILKTSSTKKCFISHFYTLFSLSKIFIKSHMLSSDLTAGNIKMNKTDKK